MNSYGDSSSVRGRAQVPGPSAARGSEAAWPDNGGGYSLEDEAPTSRGGPVPAGPGGGRGRAAVARAAVPVRTGGGGAPPDEPDFERTTGRATVGPAAGRATVGRATVRQVPPGGPAGPEGPGPRGPGGGRRGRGPGGKPSAAALAKTKRRRRINWIIAALAVVIMLTGGGVVTVTWYSTTVTLPSELPLPLPSTIMFAGGDKQLAKIGEVNRTLVKINQIPLHVQHAVASAEDRKFYEHGGVDYIGIARAAINNIKGGSTQGASTITQQYARNALDLEGVTYARKAREAVLASKLADKYSREQIMESYLNTVYWGRGAYSVESAAQAYFKKPVSKLSVAEGAVLAAVIKQPVPDKVTGHQGYDPKTNPQAAQDRWNYVLDGMVEQNWLPAAERASMRYPKVQPFNAKDACVASCGANTPVGYVINYVRQEMADMGLCTPDTCVDELRQGGYRITTSIDAKMQKAAEDVAWRARKGSALDGQPDNLMAAVVSINPENGRVMAYFGGPNGTGHDYAGKNFDDSGKLIGGGHPPGSSFKIYTLATALDNDISLQSRWDATDIKYGKQTVSNAGRAACGKSCTLETSTVNSFNVPFFHIADQVGPDKVVDMARKAGVSTIWTNSARAPVIDLTNKKDDAKVRKYMSPHVGFGQFPVTVLDHVNGVATFAARGTYRKAHFVVKVEQRDKATGKWVKKGGEQAKAYKRINPQVVDDVTSALSKIPGNDGNGLNGRPSAAKTGTWQRGTSKFENAHAWMVGYTPQLATGVWVGNKDKEKAIKFSNGRNIFGASLPGQIWKRFMNQALDGEDVEQFPPPSNIGRDDAGNGVTPPTEQPCNIPLLCPDTGDGDDDGNNGNGNNGGGGPGDGNGGRGRDGPPFLPPPPPTTNG